MRLNLPRHNCIHFRIIGTLTATNDVDVVLQALMDQTQTHTHEIEDEESRIAFFGSRSRVGGATHQVRGSIERSVGEDGVCSFLITMSSIRASESLQRPPNTMRPVSYMMDALSRLVGSIEITCIALFEYEESSYDSTVAFPFPLMIQDGLSGVTHIEQAQFSRRLNDEVEYRISVTLGEASITHSVEFETNCGLDNRSISQLLMRAQSISSQLVVRSERVNNANS